MFKIMVIPYVVDSMFSFFSYKYSAHLSSALLQDATRDEETFLPISHFFVDTQRQPMIEFLA